MKQYLLFIVSLAICINAIPQNAPAADTITEKRQIDVQECQNWPPQTFSAPTGVVTNNPSKETYYDNGQLCWFVIAPKPAPERIHFEVDWLDTEWPFDSVIFFDGTNAPPSDWTRDQFMWLSGRNLTHSGFSSRTPEVTIAFSTDARVTARGFQLTYTAVYCNGGSGQTKICHTNCVDNCGAPTRGSCAADKCVCNPGYYGFDCNQKYCDPMQVITDTAGSFSDHRGSGEYLNALSCGWLIQPTGAAPGDAIELTFDKFNTEYDFDKVSIYEGENENGTLLAVYSGNRLPPITYSYSGKMFVKFETDVGLVREGFHASFELLKCPNLCSTNGYCVAGGCHCNIGWSGDDCSMPTCGDNCNGNGVCEPNNTCSCTGDWKGLDCGYCIGASCPSSAYCTENTDLVASTDSLEDHVGHGEYRPNTDCTWKINNTADSITLNFERFSLVPEQAFVRVYDDFDINSRHLIAEYTGFSVPPVTIATSGKMEVEFTSTASDMVDEGFRATYTTHTCPQNCNNLGHCILGECKCHEGLSGAACEQKVCTTLDGICNGHGICVNNSTCQCFAGWSGLTCGAPYCDDSAFVPVLTGPAGQIDSHNFESVSLYKTDRTCRWGIQPTSSIPTTIAVDFMSLQVGDRVEVFDGDVSLANLTGRLAPAPFVVNGIVGLKFVSNGGRGSYGGEGFRFLYYSNSLCPNQCSSKGHCIAGVCHCQFGQTGNDCSEEVEPQDISFEAITTNTIARWKWQHYKIDVDDNVFDMLTHLQQTTTKGVLVMLVTKEGTGAQHIGTSLAIGRDEYNAVRSPEEGDYVIGVYSFEEASYTLQVARVCPADCGSGVCEQGKCECFNCWEIDATTGSCTVSTKCAISGIEIALIVLAIATVIPAIIAVVLYFMRKKKTCRA